MRAVRSSLVAALITAMVPLLWAGVATAQNTYALTGQLVSTRGTFIIIPVRGNTFANCAGLTRGYRFGMINPMDVTCTTTPSKALPAACLGASAYAGMKPAAPFGCVSVGESPTVNGLLQKPVRFTGSPGLSAKGATFTVPVGAWTKPLPGYTAAVSVPNQNEIIQLATSFRIYGPPTDRPTTGDDAPGFVAMVAPAMGFTGYTTDTLGPTMLMTAGGVPTNLAPLRKLRKNAHTVQTGRAAAKFTWCYRYQNGNSPPDHACTAFNNNMIAKARNSDPNQFGGTMNYLIQTGPNASSLAAGAAALPCPAGNMCPGGPIALLGLAGMGHQPTGRGYADLLTDRIMTGPIWNLHQEMIVTPPYFGGAMFQLITMVTGLQGAAPGTITAATNRNFGFPWTTGTAIVMQTGNTAGAAMTATFTGRGGDVTSTTPTHSLMARNITLVAPQLARTNIASGTNTAGMGFLTLTLPEPSGTAQLLAGALALAVLGAWRSRRHRA